jgi:hypothetical protein
VPAEGVTLADKQAVGRALLASGATIAEMNAVRRRLSAVKGGALARAAHPARVLTLVVSDVPGDDPATVASGPTLPDPDPEGAVARDVAARYALDLPPAARPLLDGARPHLPAAPPVMVARPLAALQAAAGAASALGLTPLVLGDAIEGEAAEAGRVVAGIARSVAEHGLPVPAPAVLLSGGETTVTLRAPGGRGGRNATFLLGLVIASWDAPHAARLSALACDTDGRDGSEANAGALWLPQMRERATLAEARAHLVRHDSWVSSIAWAGSSTRGPPTPTSTTSAPSSWPSGSPASVGGNPAPRAGLRAHSARSPHHEPLAPPGRARRGRPAEGALRGDAREQAIPPLGPQMGAGRAINAAYDARRLAEQQAQQQQARAGQGSTGQEDAVRGPGYPVADLDGPQGDPVGGTTGALDSPSLTGPEDEDDDLDEEDDADDEEFDDGDDETLQVSPEELGEGALLAPPEGEVAIEEEVGDLSVLGHGHEDKAAWNRERIAAMQDTEAHEGGDTVGSQAILGHGTMPEINEAGLGDEAVVGLAGPVAGRVPGESEDMGYDGGAPAEDADVPGLDTGDGMLDDLMDDTEDEEAERIEEAVGGLEARMLDADDVLEPASDGTPRWDSWDDQPDDGIAPEEMIIATPGEDPLVAGAEMGYAEDLDMEPRTRPTT